MNPENSGFKVFVSDEIFNFRNLEDKQKSKSSLVRTFSHNAIVDSSTKKEVHIPNDRRVNRPEKTLLYGSPYCYQQNKKAKTKNRLFRRSLPPLSQGLSSSQSSNVLVDLERYRNSSNISQSHSSTYNLVKTKSSNKAKFEYIKQPPKDSYFKNNLKDYSTMKNEIEEVYHKLENLPDEKDDIVDKNEVERDFETWASHSNSHLPILTHCVKSSRTVPLLADSDSDIQLCKKCTENVNKKCPVYTFDDDISTCNSPVIKKYGLKDIAADLKFKLSRGLLLSICGILFVAITGWLIIQNYLIIIQKLNFADPPAPEPLVTSYLNVFRSGLQYSWEKLYSTVHHVLVVPRGEILKHHNHNEKKYFWKNFLSRWI